MLEFSSISVSSYDAASLADRLTEKSAQGWDVVAIVPAGTNVTAYLCRAAGDTPSTPEPITTPEAAAAEAALAPSTSPSEPVEPAGWASAPAESAVTAASSWASGDSATDAVTTAAADAAPPAVDVAPATVDVVPATEHEPVQPEPVQPEPVQQAAAAAPAGWYADPAGRYELRYWDGAQWTEHVSRAGQQYTDPPVA